jgi:hypothetical protein
MTALEITMKESTFPSCFSFASIKIRDLVLFFFPEVSFLTLQYISILPSASEEVLAQYFFDNNGRVYFTFSHIL